MSTKSLIYQSNKSEFQDIRTMSAYLIASRIRINAIQTNGSNIEFLSTDSLFAKCTQFQDIRTMSAYLIASRTNTKLHSLALLVRQKWNYLYVKKVQIYCFILIIEILLNGLLSINFN